MMNQKTTIIKHLNQNKMEKEFVNYNQALALKELRFDEPCLAFYDGKNTESFYFNNLRDASGDYIPFKKHDRLKWFGAPLYQQVFRWFREKYDLNYVIVKAESWFYTINGCNTQEGFNIYEEAENACIDKLIEIVKSK
jgi:hypothetical protein